MEIDLLCVKSPFDTIYIGGGTPGTLPPDDMARLCSALVKNNGMTKPAEFSVEFSPATVKREKIEILKNYSCNRITVGVQSFDQKTLRTLGRRQSNKQVFDACEIISSCGVENFGIDLIFGVPGQTIGEWIGDLSCAIDLKPKHVSTYNLTFEEGTALGKSLMEKMICKKSVEEEANFYLRTWAFLKENGYAQYEISNFCLPGFESVHNSNTWRMQDWIGVGPSACSQYKNSRFANPPSISKWMKNVENGNLACKNPEIISEKTLVEDALIFGLRMNEGVSISKLKNRFKNVDFGRWDAIFSDLDQQNLLQFSEGTVKLTDSGRLVADAIAVEILAV
jgi:oxygen-independent coproporphyrinogen-3 oxidase